MASRRFGPTVGALLLLALSGVPVGSQPVGQRFDFGQYLAMSSGQRFRIVASTGVLAGSDLGSGRVVALEPDRLHMRFAIDVAGRSLRADLQVRFVSVQSRKLQLRLQYTGEQDGRPEQSSEVVQADAFLARNGILKFFYANGTRFLQLSVNSAGETRLVSDWGGARILPR
ncbi:MAG: hypothetical protein H7A21_11185 [Spirochaetales bacterium]|nr:hypothetical protein [Leptospiraceae bacterium]MCP5481989.1 hypothetical protein [Spirochaetales bacterium]